jgi:nicotinamidase-related amidase
MESLRQLHYDESISNKTYHRRRLQMSQTLLVIDVQNDYFPGGKFELWNAEETLENCLVAIAEAKSAGHSVVLIQHLVDGPGPFFNRGTTGSEIHPRVLEAAPDATIITKQQADSFRETSLKAHLDQLGTKELVLAGMMTHNCVTHTALSKDAESYSVKILGPATTTVSDVLHQLALHALSARLPIIG